MEPKPLVDIAIKWVNKDGRITIDITWLPTGEVYTRLLRQGDTLRIFNVWSLTQEVEVIEHE